MQRRCLVVCDEVCHKVPRSCGSPTRIRWWSNLEKVILTKQQQDATGQLQIDEICQSVQHLVHVLQLQGQSDWSPPTWRVCLKRRYPYQDSSFHSYSRSAVKKGLESWRIVKATDLQNQLSVKDASHKSIMYQPASLDTHDNSSGKPSNQPEGWCRPMQYSKRF